ncbi:MAG: sigma 54-interacting transcriptional regulator [Bacteroidetes bacterium]|jgi:transcriptional regulator with GAF, ATPase, and Fis domain|nr:sigma 54-interacting transcriptional regulator [Bacteroidota bacterium]
MKSRSIEESSLTIFKPDEPSAHKNGSTLPGSTYQLDLIKDISRQLSLVVDNIVVNESVKRKETDNELLLKLSYDITHIRDRDDLIRVINTSLKKIIDFDNIMILVLNEDMSQNSFIFSANPLTSLTGSGPEPSLTMNDYTADCLKWVLESDGILVIDMEEVCNSGAHLPIHVQFEYKHGIKEKLAIALWKGERCLGVFCLNSRIKGAYSKHDLELVKGISYQISTAISNILANEDLTKREQEKTHILSFSYDIATVKDKEGLGRVIKRYLKDLFSVKEYIITIRNDDQDTFRYFLHEMEGKEPADEGFKVITGAKMPISGSMTGIVLQSAEPVVFDIAEIVKEGRLSFPSASFWRSAGASQILGIRLKVANQDIGILWLQPENINRRLLNGISSQLAMALANSVANERIIKQLAEIDHYKQRIEGENIYLKEEIDFSHNYSDIIGDSPAMQKVFRMVAQVSNSESTVLILGETGTGKELIARAVHNNSPRRNKLMVKVNCAALPANLIESELFGHERGSFTGATERRLGKFELANGGTLFLDEIGEMPVDLQVKLLRALQEREIERIGGRGTIKVDVRIIAATNRTLEKEMAEGRFRSDLYYRLNIFPITLPSLRERKEDIPVLTSHFISRFAKKAGRKISVLSNKALKDMMLYDWPGNIRELEHLIERSILLNEGETLRYIHLPVSANQQQPCPEKTEFIIRTIDDNERNHIMQTLDYCKGRVGGYMGAAELLGVPASTLFSKMKKLGIRRGLVS